MIKFKEYLIEALSLDSVNTNPGSEEVVVFLGRFQPPTLAHINIMEEASKRTGKKVIVAMVKSGNAKSPFPTSIIYELIKTVIKNVEIIEISSGFIGDFISPLRDNDMEPVVLFAGTDRAGSYKGQIKRYSEQFNLKLEVQEIKRTDEDISASKVREALVNNDEESFKNMMHPKLHSHFNKLKKYL